MNSSINSLFIQSLKIPPVPPSSINTFINLSDDSIATLPCHLMNMREIKGNLPKIRSVGVKNAIDTLADIFICTKYKTEYIEFWFLDVMTDCLWRSQDEYQLPEKYQKTVLLWVLYFINIIRDMQKNYSKEEVFEILQEMVLLAGECMDEGDPVLPSPHILIEFLTIDDRYKEQIKPNVKNMFEYINIETKTEKHLYILEEDASCSSNLDDTGSTFSSCFSNNIEKNESTTKIKEELVTDKDKNELEQNKKLEQLSTKAVVAIMEFLFEYFYDDFQFYVIHTALVNPPNYMAENLDVDFHTPKKVYEVPMEKPPKSPKQKPEKKDNKKGKKDKKKGSESPPATATTNINLDEKLTDFKKFFEEAYKKIQEKRKFLLPLKDAVNDDFFIKIFKNV